MKAIPLTRSCLSKSVFFIFLSVLIISTNCLIFPQDLYFNFENIGIEQGLSQSTIYAIVQDKLGFMWFGTQDGLNRYDGYSIDNLYDDQNKSLSYNVIWSLLSDSDSNLWIGTERGGIDIFLQSENRFIRLKNNPSNSNSLSENFITFIFEDSRQNVWIGTQSGGLNFYNKKTKNILRIKSDSTINSLVDNSIKIICEDDKDNLWIGTINGLSKLNLTNFYQENKLNFKNYRYDRKDSESISSNNIWTIYQDSKKRLWVGTWGGGLNLYHPEKDNFIRFNKDSKNNFAFPANVIKSIVEDNDGNLWISTYDSGLFLFNFDNKAIQRLNLTDFVVTLYKDRTGNIWLGTFSSGVKMYSKRKDLFNNFIVPSFQTQNSKKILISAICENYNGDLIVGTYGDGLFIFNKEKIIKDRLVHQPGKINSLSNNRITGIVQSKDERIWIATNGGGLSSLNLQTKTFKNYFADGSLNSPLFNQLSKIIYDAKKNILYIGYFNGRVSSFDLNKNKFNHFQFEIDTSTDEEPLQSPITEIYLSNKNVLWVANFKGYLFKLDPLKNKLITVELPFTKPKTIKNAIYCIDEVSDSLLWLATYGDGLYRFNLKNNSVEIYNESNSKVKNVIYGFLIDNNGNLWCSSNKGIFKFSDKDRKVKYYNTSDGLQSNEFNQGAYFKSQKGEMFFGGVNGLNSFFPDKIIENNFVPPVFITSFKVFNQSLNLPNPIPDGYTIKIPYSKNFFSFEFVALNYVSPEKNQYAYILEGFDNDWNKISSSHRLGSYTNLNPGTYVLKVIGSNNDGLWNKTGTFIKIEITPPFWMTWWFRGSGILILIVILLGVFKLRIKSVEKKKLYQELLSLRLIEKQEEERSRIAQEMHDTLGQDLLFIKNRALLTMQKFPDNQILNEHLNLISDSASMLIKKVREIAHNLRPPELDRLGLTETLKTLLQKVKDSTSLTVIGEIDDVDGLIDKKSEINIIRIFQEALSNILKHSNASECKIIVEKRVFDIKIEIKDNGIGFNYDPTDLNLNKRTGMGINGMIERVKILKGSINIESDYMRGTVIKILIPFNIETN